MTPLHKTAQEAIEMIATEDLSKWASRHDKVVTGALKSAIHAEQAQAVEPMAWIERDMQCDDFDPDSVTCSTPVGTAEGWEWVPLYLQSAPPQASDHVPETAFGNTERAELIARLIRKADAWDYLQPGATRLNACRQAADMLKADAAAYAQGRYDELQAQGPSKAEWAAMDAQQVTHYDQQALELCDKCGWKAIMPGEPCFVCNMKTEAQQVAVPTGWALVPIEPTPEMIAAGRDAPVSSALEDIDADYCAVYKAMLAAAQGVKLVTKKDSKTDWSAA